MIEMYGKTEACFGCEGISNKHNDDCKTRFANIVVSQSIEAAERVEKEAKAKTEDKKEESAPAGMEVDPPDTGGATSSDARPAAAPAPSVSAGQQGVASASTSENRQNEKRT